MRRDELVRRYELVSEVYTQVDEALQLLEGVDGEEFTLEKMHLKALLRELGAWLMKHTAAYDEACGA